jgi:hypothetical protein
MLPPERSGEMAASPIVRRVQREAPIPTPKVTVQRVSCVPNGVAGRGGNGRAGIIIPSESAAADVPKGHDPARIAIPSKGSASRGLALTPSFSSSNVTSQSTLADGQCNSNRNTSETGIAVTPTKQTTVVLSNRNKKTPPRGVAFWLTHRASRPFYPVQRANRNRRNLLKTNDGGIFYSIQKALPPGGS